MNYKKLIIVTTVIGLTACSHSEDGTNKESSSIQQSTSMVSEAVSISEPTTTTATPTTNDLTVVNIIRPYAEYGMGIDWKGIKIKGVQWSELNIIENSDFPFVTVYFSCRHS